MNFAYNITATSEVTVIDRFDFSIGGRRLSIFSTPDDKKNCSSAPYDGALYLYPSENADIGVRGEGVYMDNSGRGEWLNALSLFFSMVRGFPDTELTVEHKDKITELQIFNTGGSIYSHKLLKCKQLCEEFVVIDGDIRHPAVRIICNGIWHITSVKSFPPLGKYLLGKLKFLGGVTSDYQLAVDENGQIYHTDNIPPLLEMLSVSATFMLSNSNSRELLLEYRGEKISIKDGYCHLPCKIIQKS